MSRFDAAMLQQAYGLPADFIARIPKAETYINQGEVIALDGAQARNVKVLEPARSHRYSLLKQKPRAKARPVALCMWLRLPNIRCRRR